MAEPTRTVALMARGTAALDEIDDEMGLAFDDWDKSYYYKLFVCAARHTVMLRIVCRSHHLNVFSASDPVRVKARAQVCTLKPAMLSVPTLVRLQPAQLLGAHFEVPDSSGAVHLDATNAGTRGAGSSCSATRPPSSCSTSRSPTASTAATGSSTAASRSTARRSPPRSSSS